VEGGLGKTVREGSIPQNGLSISQRQKEDPFLDNRYEKGLERGGHTVRSIEGGSKSYARGGGKVRFFYANHLNSQREKRGRKKIPPMKHSGKKNH